MFFKEAALASGMAPSVLFMMNFKLTRTLELAGTRPQQRCPLVKSNEEDFYWRCILAPLFVISFGIGIASKVA
jgi:hypothetical protein